MSCNQPISMIHQLPEWEEAGYAPSIEYYLPADAMSDDVRQGLDPWLASLLNLTPDQAASHFHARWKGSLDGPLEGILRYFMQYRPKSIVTRERKSWLLCELPESDIRSRDYFLLPGPIDVQGLRDRLAQCGFDNPQLVEFLGTFSGLREDFEPGGGAFLEGNGDWISINEPWMAEVLTNYHEWQNGLIVFNSKGGDGLVVHGTGKVGWWKSGDTAVTDYAVDLTDFCQRFAEHKSSAWGRSRGFEKPIPWPFEGPSRK